MAVTKIDDELLKRIRRIIKIGDNRFEYPSTKAFIDKAVLEKLKKAEAKK